MRQINFRFIAHVVGLMCLVEVLMMLACLFVSIYYDEFIYPFALAMANLLVWGGIGLYYGRNASAGPRVARHEGMLTVTITWIVLSLGAVIPLMVSGTERSFFSALFETISGFTTTGATTYDAIDHLPRGILFLRSLMQWQGGIGIVVFTVALIPMFGGGVSHVFNAETTGITHDRFLPKVSDVAKRLSLIYLLETVILVLLLWAGPMSLFHAVCHAMSCISTGGYSTHNAGVGYYNSAYVEYVLSIFMYIGSLNLALVYFMFRGRPTLLFKDEEFRWFSGFILVITLITTAWLWHSSAYPTLELTFRRALFQVISLGSSTGFITADITSWQPFFWMLAILLMFINGCTGSTSGGLKMGRFVILMKNLRNEFKKQIFPHQLTPVLLNGKQVSISIVHQVLAFSLLYTILIFVGALIIMLDGNGFDSSISIATSCVSNSGPGIGKYVNHVATAGDVTKFTLSFLMLAGRLEVFTFIGLITPYFWRK